MEYGEVGCSVFDLALDGEAAEDTAIAGQLGSDLTMHIGYNLGHGEAVLEVVFRSLHQRAGDVLAAVVRHTGHWDVQKAGMRNHVQLDGLRVLVGGELGVKVQLLALVDHAGVSMAFHASSNVQSSDFVVAYVGLILLVIVQIKFIINSLKMVWLQTPIVLIILSII